MVQPAELLARLINILGYIPPGTEDATAAADYSARQPAFVEQQEDRNGRGRIEDANGKESMHAQQSVGSGTWAMANERILPFLPRLRSRAASEIRLHETKKDDRNVERTWSGPIASKKIQELMKARTNESSGKDRGAGIKESAKFSKLRKAFVSTGPWRHRFSTTSEKRSTELERREINGRDAEATYPNDRRDSNSTYSSRRHYYTHTGATVGAVDDRS